MAKLVLALLTDENQLQSYHELNMEWVDTFNKEFESQEVPFKEEIYKEELVDMTSHAILNQMVYTEDDEQFKVNREPLKEIIRKLFGYEQQQQQQQQ